MKKNKLKGIKGGSKTITTPLVSVVMPVFNAEKYLDESIQSILSQTYQNFEFIMVDDSSTDNSYKILKSYERRYKQIKVLKNTGEKGSSKAVELAIKVAKGDYLARMDADDISLPHRLEKQVEYLEAHKKTVALGGQCILIDSESKIVGFKNFPTEFEDIAKYIFKFCPVQQPTLMIALHRLPKNFDFYSHGMNPVEDVELLFKLFQQGKVENTPDFLLKYRIHGQNSSLVNFRKSFALTLVSRVRGYTTYGFSPSFSGLAMTTAQAGVVLILPQSASLFLYKVTRKLAQTVVPLGRLMPLAETISPIAS